MKSRIHILIGRKMQQENRRITLRTVWLESGVSKSVVYGLGKDTLEEYPRKQMEKLCTYFDCDMGDILATEDVPEH